MASVSFERSNSVGLPQQQAIGDAGIAKRVPALKSSYPHTASMKGKEVRRMRSNELTLKSRAFMSAILVLILLFAIASNPITLSSFIAIGITALLLAAFWKKPVTDLFSYFKGTKKENVLVPSRKLMEVQEVLYVPGKDEEL